MQALTILLILFVLVGCSKPPASTVEVQPPQLKIGERYGFARERLISAGWEPVPAVCSPDNVCFGSDHPEMASDMRTGKVCPTFTKGHQKLTVCLKIILDGANVESFRVGR